MLIWLNMLTLDLPGSHSTKKCSASLQTPMFHSFMERKPFMNWLHVFQGFTQTNRMWGSEGSLFVAVYNISWVYGLNQDQWKVKANECGCNIYITWGNHWYPAKEETPNIYIYSKARIKHAKCIQQENRTWKKSAAHPRSFENWWASGHGWQYLNWPPILHHLTPLSLSRNPINQRLFLLRLM